MAGAGVRAENLHHFLDAGVLKSIAPRERGKPHRCVIVIKVVHVIRCTRGRVFALCRRRGAVAEMKGIIERHQAK